MNSIEKKTNKSEYLEPWKMDKRTWTYNEMTRTVVAKLELLPDSIPEYTITSIFSLLVTLEMNE